MNNHKHPLSLSLSKAGSEVSRTMPRPRHAGFDRLSLSGVG